MWKTPHFCKNMSLWRCWKSPCQCLHFPLMVSEGEVKSPCFLQVWWALKGGNKNSPAVVISNIKLFLLFLCNHIYKKEPKKWVKFWNFAYMEVYTYSILIIYPISMAFFSWIDDVESYFKWFPLSLMISEFNVKGPKSANFPNFNVFFYRIQF
jgi:hypothetical protein